MNLLNKLTIKNLKLNKKRTIVTIIGIILSVALITAVATMYSSMIKSLIKFEINEKGDFHVAYYNVPKDEVKTIKNNRCVEDIYLTQNVGYSELENSKNENKPYIFVKEFTKESLEKLSIKLVDGRLPEKQNEIVIPTHLKTNGRVTMNIGDTITLNIGERVSEDGEKLNQENEFSKDKKEYITNTHLKTYKIVGIIERPATNIESYSAPGYTFISCLDEEKMTGSVDVYAKYTKKGSKEYLNVTSNILNVDGKIFEKIYGNKSNIPVEEIEQLAKQLETAKYQFEINTYLIMLENNPLDEETASSMVLAVIIVIGIILITSIFCIKNSFDISITEKIKQYGMLRSIGATKKQIRKNVFFEATLLGLIGIPLGLISGFFASYVLVILCNYFLKDMITTNIFTNQTIIVLSYSWISFAIAIILGIITIYFSAFKSAKKAAKVSPIESIKNSSNIKIKSKKLKCPKIITKTFGIGGEISYKNLKRNKKKYRTTIVSIIVSVSIFIAISYFIGAAFKEIDKEINIYDYNVSATANIEDESMKNKMLETIKLDNIEDYGIYRRREIILKNSKFNKDFIKITKPDEETKEDLNHMNIISIDENQFKKYLKELNLNYEEYEDKGLLYEKGREYSEKEKNIKTFDYKNNDTLSAKTAEKIEFDINIYNTTIAPLGFKNIEVTILFVSDKTFEKICSGCDNMTIYYQSNNADKLQDEIYEILDENDIIVNNINESAKMMKNLYTLIAIFLYGFIIVISLIGITNIFNTITTNMSLRRQEFAMLKSVGMTKKEFNKMIRLESIFMGIKSLAYGTIIGVGLSYLMYSSLGLKKYGESFDVPYSSILIAAIVIYILITALMKYSLNKINKQNTIETIRNENI